MWSRSNVSHHTWGKVEQSNGKIRERLSGEREGSKYFRYEYLLLQILQFYIFYTVGGEVSDTSSTSIVLANSGETAPSM